MGVTTTTMRRIWITLMLGVAALGIGGLIVSCCTRLGRPSRVAGMESTYVPKMNDRFQQFRARHPSWPWSSAEITGRTWSASTTRQYARVSNT